MFLAERRLRAVSCVCTRKMKISNAQLYARECAWLDSLIPFALQKDALMCGQNSVVFIVVKEDCHV